MRDAVVMGRIRRAGGADDACISVPRGINITETAKRVIETLGHYRKDHEYRKGINLEVMREGRDYLSAGLVNIVTLMGTRPIRGPHRIQVYL